MKPSPPEPVMTQTHVDEEPPSSLRPIAVESIVDESVSMPLSKMEIENAVRTAANLHGFSTGSIGIRITDDPTIRELNDKHLGHDYATDVISFGYHADPPQVDGELVASVDTASQKSALVGWPVKQELLLYIVHGVLHICGMEDHESADRAAMRAAEEAVFLKLGIDEISRCGADRQSEDSQ